ncbi:MAG: polysaccharide deacetylase family protein [Tissierellia bacterium]|nr:polysaccharide deacetylase family protein [Tissierellia bacterium]
MRKFLILVTVLCLLLGCSKESEGNRTQKETEALTSNTVEDNDPKNVPESEIAPTPAQTDGNGPSSIDLSLKPNEAGQVMILMYHNIGPEEEEWVRTPENFRRDLENLYEKGYIPVRLTDFVQGKLDIPAGKTPYVITFDDARENNFRYLEDGNIDPNCAVGILLDFAKAHPDIQPHATFFANGEVPFRVKGEEQKKVAFLLENGMDLGNHTVDHPDFTDLHLEDTIHEVGHQAQYLESLLEIDYKINTLALPFGSRPEEEAAKAAVVKGNYNGFEYENIAVLNVGWDPVPSPYHKGFDPVQLNRIRASEIHVDNVGIYDWLKYFDENPELRYISDGDSNFLTVPHTAANEVNTPGSMRLFIY